MVKLHKIAERVDSPDRAEDKDPLDGLSLLEVPIASLANGPRAQPTASGESWRRVPGASALSCCTTTLSGRFFGME
jgi:hypothetical protein